MSLFLKNQNFKLKVNKKCRVFLNNWLNLLFILTYMKLMMYIKNVKNLD